MPVKDSKTGPSAARKGPEYVEKASPFSIDGIRNGAVQSNLFKGLVVISGLIMAGGVLISSLSTNGISGRGTGPGAPTGASIADVAGEPITDKQLVQAFAYQQQMGQYTGQKTTAQTYLGDEQRALTQLTNNAATIVAAQKAGIQVSDEEVDKKINEEIQDQLKQPGLSDAANRRSIERQYGSMEAAEEKMRTGIDNNAREGVRKSLMVDKLEKSIKDANKTTEDDYKRSVTKLDLYQIVMHPKLPAGNVKDFQAEQKKNADATEKQAQTLVDSLKKTPTLDAFKAAVAKNSDDPTSKKAGGSLGFKLPTELYQDPSFPTALQNAALDVKVIGPLKDASAAQYIFFINGRKVDLPKDYNKNKKKLLADFESQQDNDVWNKKQQEYQKAVTPEISDPALSAFQIQTQDIFATTDAAKQKTLREDALNRYQTALGDSGGGLRASAINYQMSQLYRDLGQKPEQIAALKTAAKDSPNDGGLILEYARTLRDAGQPKDALAQLKLASQAVTDNPSQPSMFGGGNPDDNTRQQIASEYDLLKQPKLAAQERGLIKPAAPGGMGGMGGLGGLGGGNIQVVPQGH